MVFNEKEDQEKNYLKKIISIIKNTIKEIDLSIENQAERLREHKNYLWENKAEIDAQEKRSVREGILNILAIGNGVIERRERLNKILSIPYFGRIDFRENKENSKILHVYIGVHTFYDPNSKINLIYDWRAPISGMYYDYELGNSSYISPHGKITGNISLKRQYRIRNGIMEFMIESSVTVHDEILQKELSAGTDEKMKNIVATIQREQNKIIRNENADVLIIQGVAGSGKTSIALHRIAYLLYTYKENFFSKDILIISPNKIFSDYISNVLPELGEENVPETSMEQILSAALNQKYKFQTFFEQIYELLEKPNKGFADRIKYKSTFEFISKLDQFILHIENNYFKAYDVKIRHITIPHEYFDEVFRRFHRYPIRQRFEVMAEYISEEMKIRYKLTADTTEKNILKKEIRKMFTAVNDIKLYRDFFQWSGAPEMFKMRKNYTLEYSDLAPLVYLKIVLGEVKINSSVKHLLIDEMQDYSPIQYKVIAKMFPCRKTILGDSNQSVNPYGSSTSDIIKKALASGEVMKLNKSYRSTYEIINFAQKIQINNELEAMTRHGDIPQILKFKDRKEETTGIIKLISDFRKSNYQSLGIICKNEDQASKLFEKLKTTGKKIFFLSSDSSSFTKGIIITFAHMSKGLEFDEVIIPYVDEKNYNTDISRSMLYVAVTRAMHKLNLTYSEKLTSFISLK